MYNFKEGSIVLILGEEYMGCMKVMGIAEISQKCVLREICGNMVVERCVSSIIMV